jgi:polyphenol oxidase
MILAPNFSGLEWLEHGFGLRGSVLPAGIRTVKQIHSNLVIDAAGLDPDCQGDALVSNEPGVLVGVKTADCVPVLLVDTSTRAVAAVHAGWRGSAANIVSAAVREMSARWNTRPENLRAAIGPSIGVCCYEVGADVARHFGTWIPEMETVHEPIHLDLQTVNERQLRELGVVDIWKSGECTFCRAERFFSFRRERAQAGRLISFIGLL